MDRIQSYLTYRHFIDSRIVRLLSGRQCASALIVICAAFLALEGIWGWNLHQSLPFPALCLVMSASLFFCLLKRHEAGSAIFTKRHFPFFATHAGFLLVIWGGLLGAPLMTKADIAVFYGKESNMALDAKRQSVTLPFSISLEDFSIDFHKDGLSPKQFTSRLIIRDMVNSDKAPAMLETSVNNPCSYKGYRIYQQGYDTAGHLYSVLRIVRDPLLPLVYLGMLVLFLGAAVSVAGRWNARILLTAMAVLALAFGAVSVKRINFGMLPPALRSWFFAPHLILYMIAYSAMSLSLIFGIIAAVKRRSSAGTRSAGDTESASTRPTELSDRLLRTSSVLLLSGMLCGCIWAKQAWGDYWEWDPKECWAAVTWLLSLLQMHLSPSFRKSPAVALAVILASFISLQVTWYGVNYLPSAGGSMHTYNSAG